MVRLVALASLFLLVGTIPAAPPARLVGESRRTLERLDEILDAEKHNQFDRAFELALRLIDQAGNDWVPVQDRFITVRQFILEHISKDEKLRSLFNVRFDRRASDLLIRAEKTRDISLLMQIILDWSPTHSSTKAYELLGEIAFEQGDFAAARNWWVQCKDRFPAKDEAIILAKILLATAGCREPTEQVFEQWKSHYGDLVGSIAGHEGRISEIIEKTIKAIQQTPPTEIDRPKWPNDREGKWQIVRERVSLPGRTPSPITIPTQVHQRATVSSRQLRIQPALWRDYAVVADGSRVSAIHLPTGKFADVFSLSDDEDDSGEHTSTKVSIQANRVITRLAGNKKGAGGNYLCLEESRDHEDFRWRMLWQLPAKTLATTGTIALEGSPVVRDRWMYFAWSQTVGSRVTIWLTAYPIDRITDGPKWSVPVIELAADSTTNRLQEVVLAGPNVVYVSDNGLVVAHNAENGNPAWAYRYPIPDHRSGVKRTVNETVCHGGRVFIAPADADVLFALDQWTGKPLWSRPLALSVAQLVGVSSNRLVITANGQFRGLASFDAATGKFDPTWGSLTAAMPFGRSVLLADCVLFPTRHAGVAMIGTNGEPIFPPTLLQQLSGGNIACNGEYLVTAFGEELCILRFKSGNNTVLSKP